MATTAAVANRTNAAKKMSTSINIKPLTTLQKLMISPEFDGFIIAVILVNCIFMASESPVLAEPAKYIVVANYFFNVTFIMELVSQIVAFGILPYFADYWHWLDAIVVSTSALDIIIAILNLLNGLIRGISISINTKVLRVLRVVRFFRILRPLKALRYFKGILVFVESLALSADILLITTGMFLTALVAIAFLTNSFIGDLLLNRCLPATYINANGTTVLDANSTGFSNPNYIVYGIDYFFSTYNLDYCKTYDSCPGNLDCLPTTGNAFDGVPGDYSTPWHAFKTNLSFVTLRGWPLIFAAIERGYGIVYAFLVLISTMLICPLFILNMFPAIFIISLKRCEDAQLRLDWLAHFPGDKETVTELELFIWANSNQSLFFRLENQPTVNILTQLLSCGYFCLTRVGILSKKAPPKKEIEMKKTEEKDNLLLDEDEDEVFLGNEEDDPDFGKGKLCVPKGRSMAALRSLLTAETSPFSQFINVIIVLNILSLAADAQSTPPIGRLVVLYLNYAFVSIFMLEVVVKISLLGPCLYLDNPFNLLDFSLVILSIPTFTDSSFQVIGALRILRLARLAKLDQINRLYAQLNEGGGRAKVKIRIDLGRLSGMLFDLTSPMINNIILVLILMYIYALIGMQFFAEPKAPTHNLPPFSLVSLLPPGEANNATAVEIGSIFSAGEYLPRMNFNCFGNAFVTVFNVGVLNGWYLFMVNTIRLKGNEGVLWYFFSYVYLIVFLLGSTLIASVASVMDRHAKAMVRDIASANKSVVDRYACLCRRQRLRKWFKRLKKNTIESDEGAVRELNTTTKLKREAVLDGFEDALVEPILQRLRRERADYSFYIFSRRNPLRRLMKFIVESLPFQLVITFAVLISVIGVISKESTYIVGPDEPTLIVIIFLTEMGCLWLTYGLFTAPDAYFNQPLYLIDFFVNIAMVVAYKLNYDELNQLRLFRMLKLPNLMLYITDSNTLRLFFVMLFAAIPSIGSVINLSLGIIFLSAVVGVQLYTGVFSHCSNPLYPGGRSRYQFEPAVYPTGCSGTGYDNSNISKSHAVFNATDGYGLGTIIYNQHWQPKLDNFDSIFTACKSTLRVIMSNEWQGILFSSLDIVGLNYQPKTNYHRTSGGGNFIFLFILSLMGVTLGALYVSIFYYHYVITTILEGRKSLIGRQAAVWALYEEKLILIRPTVAAAGNRWVALAKFYRRTDVKFMIVAYCIIPMVLLIGYYTNTNITDKDFLKFDSVFNIVYLIEYTIRGMSDLNFEKGFIGVYKGTNRQEVLVVIMLIIILIINGKALLPGGVQIVINTGKSRDLEFVCAASILRVYRLCVLFPNALRVIEVMQTSLGGFLSLVIYGLIVIMIYGLLGYDLMRQLYPTYGSPFLNDSLNFRSLKNSFLTLLAIGIAAEQVTSFQHAWREAKQFDRIKYTNLHLLISKYLPPPLGLAGTDAKYLEVSRFIKKILLCMPADKKRFDDNDKFSTRTLFPPEEVPSDIRNTNEKWDPTKHRFTFRQVIVAVHKRALFDLILADEAATNAAREIHRTRLDAIVVYLGRLTLARYEAQQLPFKSMLLIQRIKPAIYRNSFTTIMRAQLHTLRLKIHVFGFSAFDAFIVTTLREAVTLEQKASLLQLDVKKALEVAAHHSRKSMEALDTAKKYLTQVKGLSKIVDELYDSNMQTVWDISSLQLFASGKEKRAVTAVAIDFSGKVYVALNSGLLKIYKTRDLPGLPLRLVQKVDMRAKIRSLVVSQDAKKIFVGCGDKVIVLVLSSSRKRLNYKELLSFSGHSAAVNVVVPFGRFILSAGQDSLVYLWRLNSKEPANSYDAGSAVFCMCVMPVFEANVAVDEMTLTDILVCGTQRGKLVVLPLPLLSSSNESATWNAYYVDAGECGVSSVQVAWGFVYAGFTDGRVKTWAVEMIKNKNTIAKPIRMVNFLPVQSVQVHAGPVTCLAYTGGRLFSASYDFSILPWTAPDRRNAKTEANFTQSYGEGLINHSNCILSISTNKRMIVTADEGGRIVVLAPKRVREDFMASGADSGSNVNSKPEFNFSFIEYDFCKCFLDNNGGVFEEEVILTVQNLSGNAATIRCLLKRHPSFRVEICENENRNTGCQIVSLASPGSTNSKVATLFDNLHVVQFRIIFHPIEVRVVHLPIQFLINEKDMVSIQVRGSGCKSKIYVGGNVKLYEMNTVKIGESGVQSLTIENREDRPILINCLSECEDKRENKNREITTVKHNLDDKYFSVIPRCFSIPARGQSQLIIRFKPKRTMDVFKIPIRAIYGGGEGTLAEVRVRCAEPPGSVTRDTMAAPPRRISMSNNSVTSNKSKNSKNSDKNSDNDSEKSNITKNSKSSKISNKEINDTKDLSVFKRSIYGSGLNNIHNTNNFGGGMGVIDEEKEYEPLESLMTPIGAIDEAEAAKVLYKGLRKLSPSETPCPTDLLIGLLHDIGWSIAVEGDVAVLMHRESGVFIEIPNCHTSAATATDTGRPEALPSVNEFQIDFMYDKDSYYEVWYGDRLIVEGPAEKNTLHNITIEASELYHETDRFGTAIPTTFPFTSENEKPNTNKFQSATGGYQTLALMVFARDPKEKISQKMKKDITKVERKPLSSNVSVQSDGRTLLQVTYIKVIKGFRLGMLPSDDYHNDHNVDGDDNSTDDDHGSLQLEERIHIGGIMRVVTYMDNDLGTLTEIFEKETQPNTKAQGAVLHKKNEPVRRDPKDDEKDIFSRAILSINTTLAPSINTSLPKGSEKKLIPDKDFIPEKTEKTKNISTPKSDSFMDSGPTHVKVTDRAVAFVFAPDPEAVEHRSELLEAAKSISGIKHVHLDKPVLTGEIDINKCGREISIELIKKPVSDSGDDLVRDESLAFATVSGHTATYMRSEQKSVPYTLTFSVLPHLIHSLSHGVYLKVVKPVDEPDTRMKRFSSLVNQVLFNLSPQQTSISSIFGGQYYFLVDQNSLKLVSSSQLDPVQTADITFLTRGFVAEFRNPQEQCMACMDGRYVRTEHGIGELPKTMKAVLSKLQLANNRGVSSQFTDAPLFLRSKWGEFVKHSLHRKVVNAMFSMVERSRLIIAGRAAQEAAAIIKEYETSVAAAASSSGSKVSRKGVDVHKKKEADDKSAKILDSAPPTIGLTFREVYADMTKITNDYAAQTASEEQKTKKQMKDDEAKGTKQLASTVLNVRNLTAYLQREILSGFDEPLSAMQCGVVLEKLERNHQTFAVKLEQFATWYRLDEEAMLKAELKAKRVFAYLLEEIQHSDDILEGKDQNEPIKGSGALVKIVKEMQLLSYSKKWELQEEELKDKKNDNNEFILEKSRSFRGDNDTDAPKSKTFLPSMKVKNPITSLTTFIRKMSMSRKMKKNQLESDLEQDSQHQKSGTEYNLELNDQLGVSGVYASNDTEEMKVGDIDIGMGGVGGSSRKRGGSQGAHNGDNSSVKSNSLVDAILGSQLDSRKRRGQSGGKGDGGDNGEGGAVSWGVDGALDGEGDEGVRGGGGEDSGDEEDSFGDFSEASEDENEEYRGDSGSEGDSYDDDSIHDDDDDEEEGEEESEWDEVNDAIYNNEKKIKEKNNGKNNNNNEIDSASNYSGSEWNDDYASQASSLPVAESPGKAKDRNLPSFTL